MTIVDKSDDKPDVMTIETAMRDDLEGNPGKAPQVFHIGGFSVLGLSTEDAEFYQDFSAKDRKKTMHKVSCCSKSLHLNPQLTRGSQQVDKRLIPMLAALTSSRILTARTSAIRK